MINTVTLKELRPSLPNVIDRIDSKFDRYIVTKRGKPVVMMLSVDDYESLIETIDILTNKDAVKRIKLAKKEIREGKIVVWDKARHEIERL